MHVLITGGTGFIGAALCTQLFHAGHTVSVLTRARAHAPKDLVGVRLVERLEDVADGVDAVVNLAGENLSDGRWTDKRKQAFRDSRIGTTRRLVDWLGAKPAATRPKVLVSGSAIGWYGPRPGSEPLHESSAPGDDFAARLCRDWEATARVAEAFGVRVCTLRTGIVLGAGGGALAKMLTPFRLGLGGPMGTGEQVMSWVHRDDLVRMIQWLLETPRCSGPYNGTAPQPVSNAAFAQALGAALHRPAKLTTPAAALKLLLGTELAQLLLTGQRVLPAKATVEGFEFRYPALDGALRSLV